ncbi:MAG: hypothetical protein ACTSU7_01910 [Candidatus Heimdallarchaeaceae archaeon]
MSGIKLHKEQYYLDVKFGTGKETSENIIRLAGAINPIDELYIVQDINRFLPTFRLKIQDIEGHYTNLKPYDKKQNRVRISFSRNGNAETATVFDFDVHRRFPTSDFVYDIEGALQINKFFKPTKIRGFSTLLSVRDNISSVAINELGVDEVNISTSLNFNKNILQPNWTNAELLKYLKNNLIGKESEACYFCFITCKGMKKVFVFKSLKDFYSQSVKYTFSDVSVATYNKDADKMYYPILDFKAYDNYKMMETSGCKRQDYSYFNYTTSKYMQQSLDVKNNYNPQDDYYSLTQYFSIDQDSSNDNIGESDTGRSNDFTSNFKGKSKSKFFKRINNLSKFWITSWGLEDIVPGDIVCLQFLKNPTNMLSQQYHGFWMVERVIHILGQTFGTRLLLTRNGINTIEQTMLVCADEENRKKK